MFRAAHKSMNLGDARQMRGIQATNSAAADDCYALDQMRAAIFTVGPAIDGPAHELKEQFARWLGNLQCFRGFLLCNTLAFHPDTSSRIPFRVAKSVE